MGERVLGGDVSVPLCAGVFRDGPHTLLTLGPWGQPSFLFMSFHTATQLCCTTSASIPQGRQGAKLLPVSCMHKQLYEARLVCVCVCVCVCWDSISVSPVQEGYTSELPCSKTPECHTSSCCRIPWRGGFLVNRDTPCCSRTVPHWE